MKKLFTIIFLLTLTGGYSQTEKHSFGPAPFEQTETEYINTGHTRFNDLPAYSIDVSDYDWANVLVNFDMTAPTVMDTLMSFPLNNEFIGSMEQVDGFEDKFYVIGETPDLYIANTTTDEIQLVGSIIFDEPQQPGAEITGLAFNPFTGEYYMIDTFGDLWHLDPVTLSATYINNTGIELPIAVAFDGTGVLYTYDIVTDLLFSIDHTTGVSTVIGYIGFNANYGQGMDFDPVTNTMYMAAYSTTATKPQLRSVDLTTGNTTLLGYMGPQAEITQYSALVFIKDNYTPVLPPIDLTATVDENDITLNWSAASEYDGFNIYRDGVKLNVNPLQDTFYLDANLLPDIYAYEVTTVFDTVESDPAYVEAEVLPFHMGGTIFIEEFPFEEINPIDEGFAYAYQMEGNDIIDIMSYFADTLGYYSFYPVAMASYLIKAEPTFNSVYYNQFLPTYYGDVLSWTEATLVTVDDNIYDADIHLIPLNLNNTGTASISGSIYYGDESGEDPTPAADIRIMISKPMSDEFGMEVSDMDGGFNFTNLEDGTYEIFADIMGKNPEKAVIEVESNTQVEYRLNLIILDETVVLSIDNDLPAIYNHLSKIYPNPAKNQARISVQSIKPVDLNVRVYNTTGQLLIHNDYENVQNQILNLDISQIPVGQYQVVISDEFGNIISRKLLKF